LNAHSPTPSLHAALPISYCDEQHEVQRRAVEAFNLSFDIFGRSSNAPNTRLTQHFAKVLEERGLIEERVDRMIYSIDDARFLPRSEEHTSELQSREKLVC